MLAASRLPAADFLEEPLGVLVEDGSFIVLVCFGLRVIPPEIRLSGRWRVMIMISAVTRSNA